MTAPGGSIGSVHGQIRIEYDNRGIARARDDMGRFVSLAGLFSNDLDRNTRRGTLSFGGLGAAILKTAKYLTIAALAATALHGSLVLIAGATQAIIPLVAAGLGLIPGILLSAVGAAVVLKLALSGVGDAMKAALEGDPEKLAEALKKLSPNARAAVTEFAALAKAGKAVQQAVQDAFFANVGPAIKNLSKPLLSLRNDAVGVATGFNGIVVEALKVAATPGVINGVSGSLTFVRDILDGIKAGIAPVIAGFAALAGQISIFGKDAGGGIANTMKQFGAFLQNVNLAALLQAAEPILKSIITLFSNLGTIVSSVFQGMSLGGGDLFGVLGQITGQLATFLSTAEGQGALGSLGDVLRTIAGTVGPLFLALLQAIAPAISGLAPLVISLANVIGTSLGEAIKVLAPVLQTLVGALVSSLLPILPQLSAAFLQLAPVMGQFVQLLADHLGNILPLILPLLVQLASVLAGVLVQALSAILPALQQLLPAFAEFGEQILPSLLPLIASLGKLLVTLLPLIAQTASFFVSLLVPVFPIIGAAVVAFATVLNWLVGIVTTVVRAIVSAFQWLFNILVGNSIIPDLVNSIFSIFGRLAAIPGMVAGFFRAMAGAISGAIGSALAVIRGFPAQALAALGNLGSLLYNAGVSIIQGLINGIRAMAGAVKSAVSGVLQSARDLLPFSPAKEGPFSGRGWTLYSGMSLMKGLADGLRAGRQAVVDAMAGSLGGLAATVDVNAGTGLPGASGGPAITGGTTVNVTQVVNALPGMDSEQVANHALRKLAFGVKTGTSGVVAAAGA